MSEPVSPEDAVVAEALSIVQGAEQQNEARQMIVGGAALVLGMAAAEVYKQPISLDGLIAGIGGGIIVLAAGVYQYARNS